MLLDSRIRIDVVQLIRFHVTTKKEARCTYSAKDQAKYPLTGIPAPTAPSSPCFR